MSSRGGEKRLECLMILLNGLALSLLSRARPKLASCSNAICFLELRQVTLIILIPSLYLSVLFL